MPMNKSLYPKDWPQISLRIRQREGWRCKQCDVANKSLRNGSRIVLTVAHWPDPDPMNCADDNLQALCQRCHNWLDGPMRRQHTKETRRRKQKEAGQLDLFGGID